MGVCTCGGCCRGVRDVMKGAAVMGSAVEV